MLNNLIKNNSNTKKMVPKKVFIIPYRNRLQHKHYFIKHMSYILEDWNKEDFEMYFVHQCDPRNFNRGAVRNIGFLAIKNKYPDDYKNITFIFNDIDTMPFKKNLFDYSTIKGVVKHYYGFKYTLGGIIVVNGEDFEKTNGYPGFWGWGMEDNALQKRCVNLNLLIDRSLFFEIGNPNVLQLFDGVSRIISKGDPWRGTHDNGIDGLKTIHNLHYTINDVSDNPYDNSLLDSEIENINKLNIKFINVKTFMTLIPFESEKNYKYDLREPPRKIVHPDNFSKTPKTVSYTEDWSNIPYYPTKETLNKQKNIIYPPNPPNTPNSFKPPHVFSREYAAYIGHKPKAVMSQNAQKFFNK